MMLSSPLLETISEHASKALGRPIVLEPCRHDSSAAGGASGGGGGGGALTAIVQDSTTKQKYFIKTAQSKSRTEYDMLKAEFYGIQEMSQTNTIRVPKAIAYGPTTTTTASATSVPASSSQNGMSVPFVIFEHLNFCSGASSTSSSSSLQYDLGVQLAKMHRRTSSPSTNNNNKNDDNESSKTSTNDNASRLFGFHMDNTIGATPQPNLPWMDNWADFWDTHRLGHMLSLTDNANGYAKVEEVRDKTRQILKEHSTKHNVVPSLLHGDLWGGNKSYAREADGTVVPVVFDPATYYGDREADIAMTYLFGGFGSEFYEGYESEWPLPEGHEKRRTIYNLYHILNHEVLFGGYLGQARSMMDQILQY